MLKDGTGREITYLRISVTDRCDLRCIYCVPGGRGHCSAPHKTVSRDGIFGLIRAALKHGLRKVRLTGGEPLLRRDLTELISGIKEMGVADLSLTTNGTLLAQKAFELKRAGLDRVNISMDSLDPGVYARITGGGDLRNLFKAIEESVRAGFNPVKINMVPIRGINHLEATAFARLTIESPFHVRFIELMPIKGSKWGVEHCVRSDEVLQLLKSSGMEILPRGDSGSSRNYALPGAKGIIGLISPVSNHFCASCNRLRLTSAGIIRPCLFADTEIDISRAKSERDFEDIFIKAVNSKPPGKESGAFIPLDSMSEVGG